MNEIICFIKSTSSTNKVAINARVASQLDVISKLTKYEIRTKFTRACSIKAPTRNNNLSIGLLLIDAKDRIKVDDTLQCL